MATTKKVPPTVAATGDHMDRVWTSPGHHLDITDVHGLLDDEDGNKSSGKETALVSYLFCPISVS
jgi:hypothetical protein